MMKTILCFLIKLSPSLYKVKFSLKYSRILKIFQTPNMQNTSISGKISQITPLTPIIGIDIDKDKHVARASLAWSLQDITG